MFGLFLNKPCHSLKIQLCPSNMTTSKLLVVVGATGNQGSSVIKTFLDRPGWRIRGITRNTASRASKDLSAQGVEMVAANLDDPASLLCAFNDATAIFAVTDFWHPFADPANQANLAPGQTINEWCYEYELQQAKNIFAAAAQTAGLHRLIWSSLSAATHWSRGKYTQVYHFDSKAAAAAHAATTHPALWAKTSLLQLGFYLGNFLNGGLTQPRPLGPGQYEIAGNAPGSTAWPLVAAEEDSGPFVAALLDGRVAPGTNLVAYRAHMSLDAFCAVLARATGVRVAYREVSFEQMVARLPAPVAHEAAEGFAYASEFGYEGWGDASVLHPCDLEVPVVLPSVEEWVRKQDWSDVFKGETLLPPVDVGLVQQRSEGDPRRAMKA